MIRKPCFRARLWTLLLLAVLLVAAVGCRRRIDAVPPLEPEGTAVEKTPLTTPSEPEPTVAPETKVTAEATTEPTSEPTRESAPEETVEPTPETAAPRGFAATTQEAQTMLEQQGLAFETWGFSRGFPRAYGSSEDYIVVAQLVGTTDALLRASVVTSFKPEDPQDFIRKSQYAYALLDLLLPTWDDRATWLSDGIKAGLVATEESCTVATTQEGAAVALTMSRWEETVGLELLLEGPDPGLPVGEAFALRFDAVVEHDDALNLDITTYTPRLEGELTEQAEAFNAYVAGLVQEQVAAIKSSLGGEAVLDPGGSIQIDYQVTYASSELLSLLFEIATYTGGAHPNTVALALNYDLKTATVLKPEDLFAAGYLDVIASYCKDELTARERLEWPEGAEATAENYRNWSITGEGILITFDAYQVAPYAMGPQAVVVPYGELSDLVLPESPLAPLLP